VDILLAYEVGHAIRDVIRQRLKVASPSHGPRMNEVRYGLPHVSW
jgi:hypothetical protein